MLSDTHTTRYSFLCALLCAIGPSVLGCSADDPVGATPKKDAGSSGASGAGGTSSTTTTTSGASGSGIAGNFGTAGTTGGNGGSANAGASGGGEGGVNCTIDNDLDGTPDCMDECPFAKEKTKPGMCGCDLPDNASGDVAGDGGIDCVPGKYYEAEKGTLSGGDAGAAIDGGAASPWTIGDDVNAAAGHYLVSPAGLDDSVPGPARASYTLNIPADGMYVIWGRFYSPSFDSNRVWMRVDTAVYQKLRGITGDTWHWFHFNKEGDWDNPILFTLTKGTHTLDIANDTGATKIDRFYVTSAGDTPPAGAGADTTCNPPHTVKKGDICMPSCGMLTGTCDPVGCAGKTLLGANDCATCCLLTADAGAE
jgi:hypothetical protein